MKARQLTPLDRVLLFSRLAPSDFRDNVRRLAEASRERTVRDGEVLLAGDESQRVVWITIDAIIQRTRNGQLFPPFTPPSPVGLIEALAGGAPGTELKVLEGGLVLEVSMDIFLDVLMSGRRGLLNLMSRLGSGVVATVGLLPQPPVASVDIGEEETLSLLDRLILMSADGLLGRVALDTIAPLARLMTERRYKAGETLWTVGDVTQSGMVVARGRVTCTQPDGRSAEALPSTTIGFLDQLVLGKMAFTAVAKTDVVTLTLPLQTMVEAMETHEDLARAVVYGMALAVIDLPILIQAKGITRVDVVPVF
ncbi:MAG: hypothetical protein ACJAZO_003764 [Myxococcota bacterium]|jgi:CRP-like cAMP-binding protein